MHEHSHRYQGQPTTSKRGLAAHVLVVFFERRVFNHSFSLYGVFTIYIHHISKEGEVGLDACKQ